jgi:hypothetical protein
MSTIDWPEGESQTYVNVEDGQVRVDGDHADSGQRTASYDVPTARQRATAHRQLADALDAAADRILATRVSDTFAGLERLIGTHNRLGDTDAITAQVAKVRALLDGLQPEPEQPALEQFPVIT